MPRSINPKCYHCAFLPLNQAQEQSCYDDGKCRRRRSDYRRRSVRRNQRLGLPPEPQAEEVVVEPPRVVYAILYIYRSTKASPVHALRAELYDGQQLKFKTVPIHAMGLTAGQLEGYFKEVLKTFSEKSGVALAGYKAHIEEDPRHCPIAGCPLTHAEHKSNQGFRL